MPTQPNPFDQFDNPFDIFDEDYKGPVVRAEKPGFFEALGAKAKTYLSYGKDLTTEAIGDALPDLRDEHSRQVEDTVAQGFGFPDSAAQDRTQRAVRMADSERRRMAGDKNTDAMLQGQQEIADAEGFVDSAKAIFRNPQAVAGTVAESAGMMAPGMAVAMAGGPVGVAGVGAQSFAIEHESTIRDTLTQAGVDITDASAVMRALENPELMAKARERATARAVPVAAFDALTAGLAGRLVAGARGVSSAATRTAGELGVQAGGGMAGETAGQLAADDKITSPSDILMEGIAELPTGVPEAVGNFRSARARALEDRSSEDIQSDYRDLAEKHGTVITSAVRPVINRGAGARSQHPKGTAADFRTRNWTEEQAQSFMADARSRGYEVVDERNTDQPHIHLELPPGGRNVTNTGHGEDVDARRNEREQQVADGKMSAGAATVENALDEARAKRGMPLDVEAHASAPDKPAPAAPSTPQAPTDAMPTMGIAQLLEQQRQALADAQDKNRTPEQRRAAKSRAQYVGKEIEAANANPISAQVEAVRTQMLDTAAAQGMAQADTQNGYASTQIGQPTPITTQLPAQQEPVTAPQAAQEAPQASLVAEPASVQPQAAAPAAAPQAVPEAPIPSAAEASTWTPVEETQTEDSELVRALLNKNERINAVVHTPKGSLMFASPAEIKPEQVTQVRLAPAAQAQVESIGRALGRKVVLYDLKTAGAENLNGFATDDRHIFVNVKAATRAGNPVIGIIGHEFTHTLRRQGSPMLESLIRFSRTKINTDSSYVQSKLGDYTMFYGGKGSSENVTDKVSEELVADLVGDIIMDDKFWAELSQDNPSLFRQTLKGVIRFLTNLLERVKRIGADDAFKDIEQVRSRAVMMLRVHIQDTARGATKTTGVQGDVDPSLQTKATEKPPTASEEAQAFNKMKREVHIEAESRKANREFEEGDFMGAARRAAAVSDSFAPPMDIDTPEKKAFFKDASPEVARGGQAATFVHGTARDFTVPAQKQGQATFLAERTEFAAPYSAASMSWVRLHGKPDIKVDGESMEELRNDFPLGSAERTFAELMISHQGDPEAAKAALPDYAYVTSESHGSDIGYLDADTEQEVSDKLDQMQFLLDEGAITVEKGKEKITSGMSYMPFVTNVKKPWDFDNKNHVRILTEELHDKYGVPSKMPSSGGLFENWDAVSRSLARGNWTLLEDKAVGIPKMLRELGFDSYFVSEEGFKNLAVFDPKNLKSAYGNVGTFGTRNPTAEEAASLGMTLEEALAAQQAGDIRLSLNSVLHTTFTGGLMDEGVRAQLERWFLDEYRDVREVQKMIANNGMGGRVPANMDAHQNENLRHGAYQDAHKRAAERFINPISRALSRAGVTLEDFSRYLWWRHAGERDAYLRGKLDPAVAANVAPDALAGIDPADAAAHIAALTPKARKAFERAAKFIDGMRRFTNDTLLRSGQITQSHYDNITNQYAHYVPLRGMPDGSEALNGGGMGRGLTMNSKPLGPRAAGRRSEPQNIIEEMMRDMDNALVGEQKQRVLDSLTRLIAAHPDPDLWEIQPVTAQRKWVNGVLTVVQANGEPKDQITFMHHGVPVKIEIRHEGMKKAMLNLHEPMPKWLRSIGRLTRWLSAVKTSFSPFFLLVNPVRDGGLAVMGVGAEHGMGALKSMAKFYPHTYKALALDDRRKVAPHRNATVNQLQQYAREFAAIGGKTGYTYVSDIREQQHKLRHLMDRHAKSKGMQDILAGNFGTKDAALIARKSFQHVAHLFEVVNDMAENSTRLAVYAAMREQGKTVEEAAAYAKEVTVNFNRRGSFSKILNGFYMFFNAAMQGSARLVRLMKNPKFAAMMGSLFAASYAAALSQMFAAGDDDDGEGLYDKAISDNQAQRSISIYLGNGKSLAIPVPYGPNIFTYLGYRMAKLHYDLAKGKNPSLGKVAGDIGSQAITSMSPIDPGKGGQALLPEFMRVFANAQTNTNDFGGRIAAKVDPFDNTGNPLYPKTDVKTGTPYLWMAQAINTLTGGNGYDGGAINWTGEQMRYVTEQMTGGLGRLATESWELAENMLAGIDPDPSDVPLANVYFRGKGQDMHAGSYYENIEDYENTVADWKLAVANDDQDAIEAILKRAPWVDGAEADASTKDGRDIQSGSVMEAKRQIDREMKELRAEKNEIMVDESLDWRERKRLAREIDGEIAELQKDFNYAINSGRGFRSTQQQH